MGFYPFEITPAHLVFTVLGGFVVVFGMFSAFIKEKLYLGEAPIATIFGIILGPHVSGLIDPYKWAGGDDEVRDEITLEVTRVVIAISVFAVGVELPKAYMLRHWRSMIILLLPAMLWGWFISALFMWALIPGLKFLSCLVIAAAVTPTDPILAQSVIGGKFADKHVPAHVRHMLSAESGSNDGAAFPFLYIALYLTLDASPGHAVGEWFYATLAYEIVLGTLLGALLGYVARRVMKFAEGRGYVDRQSFVAQYVSLALLSMGGTVLLGSDDLLSAFACGCAFAWDGYFNKQTEDAVFSNVVDLLFNCAAFIYIGALLPFPSFNDHHIGLDWWRLVCLSICILVARRLPSILAMYKLIPDIKTFREACFTGWFGPMGVGAVFISTLARHSLPEGQGDTAQVDHLKEVISPITLFLVLSSILTHGLSIPFFSLGRRVHSLTYTWSRQPSIREQPAWTTHTRRVRPGESITVNRDEDDAEAGDVGLRRTDGDEREKVLDSETTGSGSESLGRSQGEMSEKRAEGYVRRDGRERDEAEEEQDRLGETGERAGRDTGREGGRRTPPVAEYREGDHLVIERTNDDTGEIDVEVIRHHFREDKQSRSHAFSHPTSLETDRSLLASIMPTLERWASAASMSTLGRGNGGESRHSSRPGTPLPTHRDDDQSPHEPEGEASSRSRPTIRIDPPASSSTQRQSGKSGKGIRSRWFNLGRRSSGSSTEDDEYGNNSGGGGGSTMRMSDRSRPASNTLSPIAGSPSTALSGGSNPLHLTRTSSVNRTIRFAPELAPSSDTVPGPAGAPGSATASSPSSSSNYGNAQSGFKRTPGLGMYRAGSIKEDDR